MSEQVEINSNLYAAALPFIEIRGNQVAFGGKAENSRWGEPHNREIEPTEFVLDKHYWEILGEPDKLVVGMATEIGFENYVGKPPPHKEGLWWEAVG